MVPSFLIPIPLCPSCTLYVCAEPTIRFFERPVNSGPFPVSRCPLTVVRRFACPRWLSPFPPVGPRLSPFVPVRRCPRRPCGGGGLKFNPPPTQTQLENWKLICGNHFWLAYFFREHFWQIFCLNLRLSGSKKFPQTRHLT